MSSVHVEEGKVRHLQRSIVHRAERLGKCRYSPREAMQRLDVERKQINLTLQLGNAIWPCPWIEQEADASVISHRCPKHELVPR